MFTKYFSVAIFLGSLSVSANTMAEVWKQSVAQAVSEVQVVSHNGIVVRFDQEVDTACTYGGTNSVYMYAGQFDVGGDDVDRFLSVALTSIATGMPVRITYDAGTSNCWAKYIAIIKE